MFKVVLSSLVKYLCKCPKNQTKFSRGDNEDEHLKSIHVYLISKKVNFHLKHSIPGMAHNQNVFSSTSKVLIIFNSSNIVQTP